MAAEIIDADSNGKYDEKVAELGSVNPTSLSTRKFFNRPEHFNEEMYTVLAENLRRTHDQILIKHMESYIIRVAAASPGFQKHVQDHVRLFDQVTLSKRHTHMLWTDIEQYQFFVEFLKGMRTESTGIQSYYLFYVLRRSALVPVFVLLQDSPEMITHSFLLLVLMAALLQIEMKQPFQDASAAWLDRACEAILYIACLV